MRLLGYKHQSKEVLVGIKKSLSILNNPILSKTKDVYVSCPIRKS